MGVAGPGTGNILRHRLLRRATGEQPAGRAFKISLRSAGSVPRDLNTKMYRACGLQFGEV